MRKIGFVTLFLATILVLSTFTVVSADNINYADKIASVAEKENGKKEGDKNAPYATGAWCARFVVWCAKQAGIPANVVPNSNNAACINLYNSVIDGGGKVVTTPKRGDLVFYKCTQCPKYPHVGIMISGKESVQGNISLDNRKTWQVYKFKDVSSYRTGHHNNNYKIVYVRPNYPSTSTVHKHEYNDLGVCKSCNEPFTLNIIQINKTMVSARTSGDNVPCHDSPYGAATTTRRLAAKGENVKIVAQTINAFGNTWYKTDKSDWIVGDYLAESKEVQEPEAQDPEVQKPEVQESTIIGAGKYKITNAASDKALCVYTNSYENPAKSKDNVIMYDYVSTDPASQWKLVSVEKNLFVIYSGKVVLNAYSYTPKSGTNANVYDYNADDNTQQWIIESVGDGQYIIRLKYNTSLVLTAEGKSNKANVSLKTYDPNDNMQKWIFTGI